MFPYDSAILAAVRSKPESVAGVLQVMQAIAAGLSDGDGLKWFNWLYLRVTRAVQERIEGGGFSDPAWLAALDVEFARLYFNAIEGWLSGGPVPGCWQALLERRAEPAVARIQFALAGINAHINRDLPVAIVTTCDRSGSPPLHGSLQYSEFTALNGTLESLVDTAKETLLVRLLGDPLPAVSRLEDTLAAWSVVAARESAWTNAELLWAVRGTPTLAQRYLEMLDGLTALAGKTLLVAVPLPAADIA